MPAIPIRLRKTATSRSELADPNQIRINELARELEIKAKVLIDYLPEIGVKDKKTHSSSLELDQAEKVRKHFQALAAQEAAAEEAKSAAAKARTAKPAAPPPAAVAPKPAAPSGAPVGTPAGAPAASPLRPASVPPPPGVPAARPATPASAAPVAPGAVR